ncbi:tRNA1(Val) (adenine(37)-N6)-methyltransferase [Paramaledivibacter caminithermalis]|jgi:tRNA1Val (adenine37-N6)-methyltransferase|uniref:tRNA1(Val) A37 N6-methylase TrmN6 n=1 Tax=Paramaledivibacter caminithermalis (strain DSM 15212 / CIP 107654 / DViRD3) TaxID=1121301 RepID=A0A1M6QAU4_PARC5|nr:tRNA1(Val) (adenine(37)-N6)-methyltransferase [Paramaledivibacter caminithermalis]SHK17213.1 tRNA1(Val) A37 N6-methylase TrmN6 [Paramaledivibacter caminithermalis DSM 15212]
MDKSLLKENERIDDLQCKGLKIIQNSKGFCFGIDAVLLSNFCEIKKNAKIVDLGTGTGIVPILIAGKSTAEKIYGIEIQKEVADMARRSIKLNNLEERIEIINEDIKNIEGLIEVNSIDVVVSNPPYMEPHGGLKNPEDLKAISRHEIKCTLEDIIKITSRLLKHNGYFYLVHRPHRLVDIMFLCRKYKLEPKKLRFVHPNKNKKPNLILLKCIKAAKPELKFLNPLYVYGEDGSYTDEIYEIYGKESINSY